MPDAPVPTLGKKEYEVVGRNAVFGAKTGETLTLDLTEEQEQFYLNGGHLKVTAKKGKESPDG
jgi:hypothetical protein